MLAFGLVFTITPLGVARFTGYFRYVPRPTSPSDQQMRYLRTTGVVFAAVGAALIGLSVGNLDNDGAVQLIRQESDQYDDFAPFDASRFPTMKRLK